MVRLTSAVAAVGALLTVLAFGMAEASAAEPRVSASSAATPLPLAGFSDIVDDVAHGHEFISGGKGVDGLEVADTSGAIVETIPGLPGASGMVLSPDGSKLYVALRDGDAIAQIDTGSLRMKKFSTGVGTCPTSVTVTAGLVWFGYGCTSGQPGNGVGALDPVTGTVHYMLSTYGAPALTASARAGNVLFVATPSLTPDELTRYAVRGGASPMMTATATRDVGGNFADMAITPDGADLVLADGGVYYHQVFSTVDLASDGVYSSTNYPDAVAISPSGMVAAGIDGAYTDDLWIYRPGASLPAQTIDFGSGNYLEKGGLAFGWSSVYAVTSDYGAPFTLRVIPIDEVSPAPLTMHLDRTRYRYGDVARLTARITGGTPALQVSLYATPLGRATRLVKQGPLGEDSTLHASFRVTRRTTFRAVYAGGPTYGFTTVTRQAPVRAEIRSHVGGAYAAIGHDDLVHVRRNPSARVQVLPAHPGGCVTFRLQRRVASRWQTLGTTPCRRLDDRSAAQEVLREPRRRSDRWRVRGEWAGDDASAASNGTWQYIRFTS